MRQAVESCFRSDDNHNAVDSVRITGNLDDGHKVHLGCETGLMEMDIRVEDVDGNFSI